MEILESIRNKKPIVHSITNPVTINDCAGVLVAVGASPIMAHHKIEVAEVTANAAALVLNLGATDDYEAMHISLKSANEKKIPVVVDPVGVATSSYRRKQALSLIEASDKMCIRGNYSEIFSLVENKSLSAGLDNRLKKEELELEPILKFAVSNKILILMSGSADYIFDGINGKIMSVETGEKKSMLVDITGSGCILSGLVGAALSTEYSAQALMEIAKEYRLVGNDATAVSEGPYEFKSKFIDKLYRHSLK